MKIIACESHAMDTSNVITDKLTTAERRYSSGGEYRKEPSGSDGSEINNVIVSLAVSQELSNESNQSGNGVSRKYSAMVSRSHRSSKSKCIDKRSSIDTNEFQSNRKNELSNKNSNQESQHFAQTNNSSPSCRPPVGDALSVFEGYSRAEMMESGAIRKDTTPNVLSESTKKEKCTIARRSEDLTGCNTLGMQDINSTIPLQGQSAAPYHLSAPASLESYCSFSANEKALWLLQKEKLYSHIQNTIMQSFSPVNNPSEELSLEDGNLNKSSNGSLSLFLMRNWRPKEYFYTNEKFQCAPFIEILKRGEIANLYGDSAKETITFSKSAAFADPSVLSEYTSILYPAPTMISRSYDFDMNTGSCITNFEEIKYWDTTNPFLPAELVRRFCALEAINCGAYGIVIHAVERENVKAFIQKLETDSKHRDLLVGNTKDALKNIYSYNSNYQNVFNTARNECLPSPPLEVAIKCISKEKLTQEPLLKQLIHECVLHKIMNFDKKTTRLIDIMESNTHIYILQEYCSKGTLLTYIQSSIISHYQDPSNLNATAFAPFICDINNAMYIIGSITEALHNIHSYGWTHRDLKPENIFLSRGIYPLIPDIKLSDFGWCNFLTNFYHKNNDSKSGILKEEPCGTIEYMSPEVFQLVLKEYIDNNHIAIHTASSRYSELEQEDYDSYPEEYRESLRKWDLQYYSQRLLLNNRDEKLFTNSQFNASHYSQSELKAPYSTELSTLLYIMRRHTALDIWGLGILLFELILGQTPFAKKIQSETQIHQEVLQSKRISLIRPVTQPLRSDFELSCGPSQCVLLKEFSDPNWYVNIFSSDAILMKDMSPLSVHILKKLLHPVAEYRPSTYQLLSHPLIKNMYTTRYVRNYGPVEGDRFDTCNTNLRSVEEIVSLGIQNSMEVNESVCQWIDRKESILSALVTKEKVDPITILQDIESFDIFFELPYNIHSISFDSVTRHLSQQVYEALMNKQQQKKYHYHRNLFINNLLDVSHVTARGKTLSMCSLDRQSEVIGKGDLKQEASFGVRCSVNIQAAQAGGKMNTSSTVSNSSCSNSTSTSGLTPHHMYGKVALYGDGSSSVPLISPTMPLISLPPQAQVAFRAAPNPIYHKIAQGAPLCNQPLQYTAPQGLASPSMITTPAPIAWTGGKAPMPVTSPHPYSNFPNSNAHSPRQNQLPLVMQPHFVPVSSVHHPANRAYFQPPHPIIIPNSNIKLHGYPNYYPHPESNTSRNS